MFAIQERDIPVEVPVTHGVMLLEKTDELDWKSLMVCPTSHTFCAQHTNFFHMKKAAIINRTLRLDRDRGAKRNDRGSYSSGPFHGRQLSRSFRRTDAHTGSQA